MADLSEADKRTLLGENYKEVLAKAQAEGRAQSASTQLWASQVEKCESNRFNASAITVVGAVMLISNLSAASGPSVMLVSVVAIALLLVGVGWFVLIWRTIRTLYANRPAD
jgi:hypothetical protein